MTDFVDSGLRRCVTHGESVAGGDVICLARVVDCATGLCDVRRLLVEPPAGVDAALREVRVEGFRAGTRSHATQADTASGATA